MACGLPVIATRVGGNLDVINNNENGILVEKENPEQLCSAIKTILDDRQLADTLGTNARQTIVSNYTMEQVCSTYIDLYYKLLAPK